MNKVLKLFAAFVVALVGSSANAAGFDSAGVVDHTGNWWNPAQNMMGVAIHQQHGLIQAEWFIYDAVNKPTWLSFSGPLKKDAQGNDTLTSPLYRTHGPQPMGYNASFAGVDQPSAGSMSITFSDACHATMHYQYTDPSGGLPQQETLTLTQLLFGDTVCLNPQKVKISGAHAVPPGCINTADPCWPQANTSGAITYIFTQTTMGGGDNRPIAFGYFIDGSGGYTADAFYIDTPVPEPIGGSPAITNGLRMPIDWVKGLPDGGLLQHIADGTCAERKWFPAGSPGGYSNVWSNVPASCDQ